MITRCMLLVFTFQITRNNALPILPYSHDQLQCTVSLILNLPLISGITVCNFSDSLHVFEENSKALGGGGYNGPVERDSPQAVPRTPVTGKVNEEL